MSGLADGKLKFEFRVGLERETWERAMGAQFVHRNQRCGIEGDQRRKM